MNENRNKISIGRHCSIEKGNILSALEETLTYGANAMAFFLGSPISSFRRIKEITKIEEFKKECRENKIPLENVIIHAPYIINLANFSNPKVSRNSQEIMAKEIEIMSKIGLKKIVIHPGSYLRQDPKETLNYLVSSLNKITSLNKEIEILIETMSGRSGEIGSNFEEIKFILTKVEKEDRIGVCWDTCHLYAAGYDIKNNLEVVIEEFDRKIGLEKLKVIHINDSLFGLGEKKDRHANIGEGKIGYSALKNIVFNEKLKNCVKILETPKKGDYKNEIRKFIEKI